MVLSSGQMGASMKVSGRMASNMELAHTPQPRARHGKASGRMASASGGKPDSYVGELARL